MESRDNITTSHVRDAPRAPDVLMVYTQAALLVQAAALAGLTVTGAMTVEWILALALLLGLISAIEIPVRHRIDFLDVQRGSPRRSLARRPHGRRDRRRPALFSSARRLSSSFPPVCRP